MPFQPPASGQGNVAEYMMSGLPFVTASSAISGVVYAINFPFLTKNVTIKNNGGNTLAVGFTLSGTMKSNRFTLAPNSAFSADFRIKTLYVMGYDGATNYEVVAGMTTVNTQSFPILTGSAAPPVSGVMGYSPYFSYDGIG